MMWTIYLNKNQYAINHGKHRFICCRTGDTWELMDQSEGYNTVATFAPDSTDILPETVETWIQENYS